MSEHRKPKYKVGQVVNVKSFIEPRLPGEVGPGFRLKPGWRWGWQFGKIVKVSPVPKCCRKDAPPCYFLAEWPSAITEDDLRPLTEREMGQ